MGKVGLPTRVLPPYIHGSLEPRPGYRLNLLCNVACCHFLEPSQSSAFLADALRHVEEHGYTVSRHRYHPTNDFNVARCAALNRRLSVALRSVILPTLGAAFGVAPSELLVCECFFVRYTPGAQSSLAPHRDGHLLSFNILLSEPSSFDGGGTRFLGGVRPALVRPERVGDLTIHCGKLLHEGVTVTRGVRYILVGFVDAVAQSARFDASFLSSRHANHSKAGPESDYIIVSKAWAHQNDDPEVIK